MKDAYHSRTTFVLEAYQEFIEEPVQKARRLLDVGFIGDYAEPFMHYQLLERLRPEDSLAGIDVDASKMEFFLEQDRVKAYCQKLQLDYQIESVAQTGFADQEFNAVFLLEVFEHLFSPYAAFDEIKRILTSGGCLIMTYPNPLSWHKLGRYVLAKNPLDQNFLLQFRGEHDHKIFPHPACLTNYLNDLGLEVRDLTFIKQNFRPLPLLNNFLANFGLTKKFSSYIGLVAVKK